MRHCGGPHGSLAAHGARSWFVSLGARQLRSLWLLSLPNAVAASLGCCWATCCCACAHMALPAEAVLLLPRAVCVQVAAGGTHSVAVTSAGRMFIWGRASYGRLGLGPGARDAYSPVEVALPGGHERWKVAAATAGAAGWHVVLLVACMLAAGRWALAPVSISGLAACWCGGVS